MAPLFSEKNTLRNQDTSPAKIMADYQALIDLAVDASQTGKTETYIRRRLCDAYEFAYRHGALLRQARGLSFSSEPQILAAE